MLIEEKFSLIYLLLIHSIILIPIICQTNCRNQIIKQIISCDNNAICIFHALFQVNMLSSTIIILPYSFNKNMLTAKQYNAQTFENYILNLIIFSKIILLYLNIIEGKSLKRNISVKSIETRVSEEENLMCATTFQTQTKKRRTSERKKDKYTQ